LYQPTIECHIVEVSLLVDNISTNHPSSSWRKCPSHPPLRWRNCILTGEG